MLTSIRADGDIIKKFHDVCTAILYHKQEDALNWCISYAEVGLLLIEEDAIDAQIFYILNNMKSWKSPVATLVSRMLNEIKDELNQ